MVEGADEVLAQRVVDPRLPPHGAVDLREESGRHLDEGDAAQEGGGGIAGHVADDPAAQGDQAAGAVEFPGDEGVVNGLQGPGVLVLLAVGEDDAGYGDAFAGKVSLQTVGI